ncbi:hypothetical protein DM860_014899 [Cuscuta australis]|uniref:Uncharacterized protein n=1 Tax=Cuscuta australis TaxID=267555 RepID=A0A328E229_9ASTE|nr:hypothetical protein DM860_014899 [Cuscuta australis]
MPRQIPRPSAVQPRQPSPSSRRASPGALAAAALDRVPSPPLATAATRPPVFLSGPLCREFQGKGNHILAIYQKEEIPVFGATLKEGKLYRISNPAVLSNNKPTIVSNKFKLSLGKRTTITEIVDDLFPKHVFNFKPFGEINALQNYEKAPMFDVIGALFLSDPAITKPINGGKELHALCGEKYASDLMKFVEKGAVQPVIVIIQFCKAGKYNEGEDAYRVSFPSYAILRAEVLQKNGAIQSEVFF